MQVPAPANGSSSAQPWYHSAFDALYPLLYAHRDDASAAQEIEQLVETLDIPAGIAALDIACGAGRHLRAMLDAGLDAFGIDLSAALLKRAVDERGLRGRLARADVRTLPVAARFDVAFNLFTSFGYFDNEADNHRAMRRMIGTLRPGGRFVIDHAHADHVREHLVPHTEQCVNGLTVIADRRIEDRRVVKHMTIHRDDGPSEHLTERVRLYRPDEMRDLLETSGVRVDGVFGDFDGSPLVARASRMICTGVRA